MEESQIDKEIILEGEGLYWEYFVKSYIKDSIFEIVSIQSDIN